MAYISRIAVEHDDGNLLGSTLIVRLYKICSQFFAIRRRNTKILIIMVTEI